MRIVALLLLALAAPAAANGFPDIIEPLRTGQTAAQDAAVIISVEAYHSSINSDVPHAHRDGDAMESYLLYTRGVPSGRITRLKGTDCQTLRYEVQRAAEQVGPKGTLWIYFSGHGSRAEVMRDGRRRGEHVLVCDDARDNRFFFSKTVPVPELQRVADASKAQRAVLMIDACYGATGRDGKQKTVRKMAGSATLVALPKVVVWSATATGEQAKALDGAQHGAFTYLALGALRGWADGEISGRRDGAVTISEAQAFLRRGLRAVRLIGQTPVASGPKGVLGWTLASGVEEKAPALRAQPRTAPMVPQRLGAVKRIQALAKKARAAEAAAAKAKREVLKAARDQALADAITRKQAEAEAAFNAIEGFVKHPRPAGRPALKAFVLAYEGAIVKEGSVERAVPIPQLAAVRTALGVGTPATRYRPKTVSIQGGRFMMGSPMDEAGRDDGEVQHPMHVSSFEMMVTEVTQGQHAALMGKNPSGFKDCGANCPVENVSWYDAVRYANALSKKEGKMACYRIAGKAVSWERACNGYRLPTEAEWEYAARAGTAGANWTGRWRIIGTNNAPAIADIAWYGGNSRAGYAGAWDCSDWSEKQDASAQRCGPNAVGGKAANPWGLHDMLGNLGEWCWDRYSRAYSDNEQRDHDDDSARVVRGGSFSSNASGMRAASRAGWDPSAGPVVGFRLVRSLGAR